MPPGPPQHLRITRAGPAGVGTVAACLLCLLLARAASAQAPGPGFDHDQTRYPLAGQHRALDCKKCHGEPARWTGLRFDACSACHADAHAGEFAAREGGECAPCHDVGGFRPTRFSVEDHARTAFALDGRHVATRCSACHAGPRPRLDLHLAGRACADCHQDPHGDQVAGQAPRGGCEACHATGGWDRPRIDHSSWSLTGAHAQTACSRCHGKIEGQSDGRDDQARYRGIARACDGCHADVHAGQFRLSQPVRGCDGCHSTDAFARAAGYDHARQAGWPLAGKHARLACAGCHPRERLRDGQEAVRYRLGFHNCKACHADPHREVSRAASARHESITAGKDCDACHTPDGWQLGPQAGTNGFDHARTGFTLRGAHTAVPCLGCHDGQLRISPQCGTCHRDTHEGQLGSACAECHTAVAWQDTNTLARHQRTRLPLTGQHATLACSACHITRDERGYSNVPWDCFACHEQDYRRDLHPDHDGDAADPSAPALARACAQCHRTTGWRPAALAAATLAQRTRRGPARHDVRFALSFGKHRSASCASCHVVPGDRRQVACDGCHAHQADRLRAQHGGRLPALAGRACLGCHPGGAPR